MPQLLILEYRTYGGKWKHNKGKKGGYREQPQTTDATQVSAAKPDLPTARIPVLRSKLNIPSQDANALPIVPPIFFKAPAKNSIGPRFRPIPPSASDHPCRSRKVPPTLRYHIREKENPRIPIPLIRHIGKDSPAIRDNTPR